MNLKTLISIKFILYIIGFLIIAYFSGNINNSYRNLEKQNEELLNQKKHYEAILKLEKNDSIGKNKIYKIIEAGNYKLKPESENENELKLSTNITIFIISILMLFYLFNYLNDKIEKLKSEETEDEKIKML
jgi:predicted PurR-regulated permease PerM